MSAPAIIAILHLCLYFGGTSSFIIAGLSLSKVYANTMLVILNNRIEIVAGRAGQEEAQIGSSSRSDGASVLRSTPSRRQRSTIMVSKDRLTFRLDPITPPTPRVDFPKASIDSERSPTVCLQVTQPSISE